MPFLDDTGAKPDETHGPLWSVFSILQDQVERWVMLNLFWSLQLIPAVLAVIFTEWPLIIRIILIAYSVLALIPASGLLFRMTLEACQGNLMSYETGRELLIQYAKPSLFILFPLYGTFGLLLNLVNLARATHLFALEVAAELLLLILAVCSLYWGPLMASSPELKFWQVFTRSVRLFWRKPALTLLTGGMLSIVTLIGVISIGGLILIVPVLIAIFQTQLLRHVTGDVDK